MKRRHELADDFDCEFGLKFDLSEYYKKTEPIKPKTPEELLEQLDKVIRCSQKHPLEKLTLWVLGDAEHDHREFASIRNTNEMFGGLLDAANFGYSIYYVFGGVQKNMWGHESFTCGFVMNKLDNYETNIIPDLLEYLKKIQWSK